MNKNNFEKNLEWLNRVLKVIPNGCSTLAKSPERLFPGYTPVCCQAAYGSRFKDIDGNEWIDCEMAMGTVVWGHAREEINEAIIHQLFKGISFSIPGEIELEVGEKILRRIGQYNFIRFCKSGADAVSAALRLSRSLTGKSKVIYGSYHGWHDWSAYGYYQKAYKELGIPKYIENLSVYLKSNTYEQLELEIDNNYSDLGSVIICPADWEMHALIKVKQLCKSKGIPLVFDEVTSGIRTGKKGVAGEYDIWPDIICLSKGLANGLPLAAVLGNDEYMKFCGQIKFSNAHSSECIALAAANAGENLMEKVPAWPTWRYKTEKIMHEVKSFMDGLGLGNELTLSGSYACFYIHSNGRTIYEDRFRRHLVKYLAGNGIFSKGYILLCDQHTDEELSWITEKIKEALVQWKIGGSHD